MLYNIQHFLLETSFVRGYGLFWVLQHPKLSNKYDNYHIHWYSYSYSFTEEEASNVSLDDDISKHMQTPYNAYYPNS